MNVSALFIEYLTNPLGLGVARPRFSWQSEAAERAVLQTAYHIQVSEENPAFSAIVWDSGTVESDRSAQIEYDGPALRSRTRYYVRVRITDNFGRVSAWSEPSYWETTLMTPSEWSAKWITSDTSDEANSKEAPDLLRRTFRVDKPVARARVYATALGLYEAELNGTKIGDAWFAPGWTSYKNRLQTQVYDVTSAVRQGENAIGITLADGWYAGNLAWKGARNLYGSKRGLLLELHLAYEDGTEDVMISDESWKTSDGPIRYAELYHGETYDARLEKTGWSGPAYDDSAWRSAALLDHDTGALIAQENLPVRTVSRIRPIAVIETPAGDSVLDFGQNLVGWVEFSVSGEAGQRITLQHAEILDKHGNIYFGNLRSAKQTIAYICKGGERETYHPRFTFQGFRYVKVTGYTGTLLLDDFSAHVLHTDLETTGTFECSEPLLNQLQSNIEWGQRGNFLDVPTDCPQRDERLGWTGDAQVFIRTSAFLMDVAPFFTKWLHDLKADQFADGGVPHVIPDVLPLDKHSSSAWGDAAVICPWTLYLCYGDERILAEQYDSMRKWVEYIRAQGEQELLWNTGHHFGDWLALDAKENSYTGATPKDLIATAYFAYSTELLSRTAAVLGKGEDARRYAELHRRIAEAFRREFVTPSGRIASPTQTAYVLALMFGLVEGADKERAVRELTALVRANGNKLTTGFVGTPYLCHVLSDNGHTELAYKLLLQKEYPSWLYSVLQGATTIWEHWDGVKSDGSFWSDNMNSYNHYAYGSIGEWMYRVAAGLDTDDEHPGYRRFVVRPEPGGGLTYAKASYRSLYGTTASGWELAEDGTIRVSVEVPANTAATVRLPRALAAAVTESGVPLTGADGVSGVSERDGYVECQVGSGSYRFSYPFSAEH